MTPPPEPRTAAGRAHLKDGSATANTDARRKAILAIEAEAAGAPLREALVRAFHQTRTSNESPEYDMDVARARIDAMLSYPHVRAALTATPARCLRPCMNSGCRCPYRSPRCDACQRGDHNGPATPAPAPLDVEPEALARSMSVEDGLEWDDWDLLTDNGRKGRTMRAASILARLTARAAATEDTSLGNTFDADEAYDFGGRAAATEDTDAED